MPTHAITIYGPGCARCEELELRTRQAVNALSGQYEIRHERDAAAIAAAGILATPALEMDGTLLLSGKVPTLRELQALLAAEVPAAPASPAEGGCCCCSCGNTDTAAPACACGGKSAPSAGAGLLLLLAVALFIYELTDFAPGSRVKECVDFFFYDTIKILLLLFGISCFMGVVNAWFPVARVRRFLTEKKLYGTQYFFASLFGALTPFCSCSSIPLFIGFVRGGIPLGVTLAFLITSPLVNEVAVALFLAVFGLKITCLYVGCGLLLGMLGGALLGQMGLERYLTPWALAQTAGQTTEGQATKIRLRAVAAEAWGIVDGVLPYVLAGIAIGAAVHGYVPQDYFANLLGGGWWSVPAAVLCAVPLYANAAGIVPVIEVLVAKGVPLGTAIAFMMAVVGLSLPEAMLLKKVMQWRLLAAFFGTVTLLIILSGYIFLLLM